jgi:hypothetical protein
MELFMTSKEAGDSELIFSFLMLISITAGFASGQNETAKEPLSIVIAAETLIVKAGSGVPENGRLTNTSRARANQL